MKDRCRVGQGKMATEYKKCDEVSRKEWISGESGSKHAASLGLACVTCLVGALAPRAVAEAPFFMGLGDLPGGAHESAASAISADGSAVVGTGASANGPNEAFLWIESSGMVGLGDFSSGEFASYAADVSIECATVVGSGTISGRKRKSLFLSVPRSRAFQWTPSRGLTSLGTLEGGSTTSSWATSISDDSNRLAGSSTTKEHAEAFIRDANGGLEGLGYLPGGSSSRAHDISGDGSVVVGWSSSNAGGQAFRWTENTGMTFLVGPDESPRWSDARAASHDGAVIVGVQVRVSNDDPRAFRWTVETGLVDLGDFPEGTGRTEAVAVSAQGLCVVGWAATGMGKSAFIWDAFNGMHSLQRVLALELGLDLTGWVLSGANGISADGCRIVGFGTNPDGLPEAWIANLCDHGFSDLDGDGVPDTDDNCPVDFNADQADEDADGTGDLCDACIGADDSLDCDADGLPDGCELDSDADGVPDECQNVGCDGGQDGDTCAIDAECCSNKCRGRRCR